MCSHQRPHIYGALIVLGIWYSIHKYVISFSPWLPRSSAGFCGTLAPRVWRINGMQCQRHVRRQLMEDITGATCWC